MDGVICLAESSQHQGLAGVLKSRIDIGSDPIEKCLEVQVTDMYSSGRRSLLFKKVRLAYCPEGLSAKRPGDRHVHVFLR